MKRYPVLLTIIVLLLTFSVALPVLADPPDQGHIQDEGTFFWPVENCGFDVQVDYWLNVHWKNLAYDSEGNVIISKVEISFQETWTNLDNGKSILGHGAYSERVDWSVPSIGDTGLGLQLRLPNGRVVIQDVGRAIFDPNTMEMIFIAGHRPMYPDWAVFVCDLLR